MRNLKCLILTIGFFFITTTIFAQAAPQAVIRDLVGTVEIQRPGSAAWQPATRGATLTADTVISTGFRSTAVIAVGNSVLTVRPLTRLSLAELSRAQDEEKVELNLTAGRVRAEVRSAEGVRTDFTVRSTSATASVRGTIFEFDTRNLKVSEGTVAFSGVAGVPVFVDTGSTSFVDDRSGRIASPTETFIADLRPDLPLGIIDAVQTDPIIPAEINAPVSISVGF
ncbi:MAG: FecR domain-containing protein [Spirochaetaceae bacterium]|nr:FecR domain-containing protein [Spirochaetaceae bacterium]